MIRTLENEYLRLFIDDYGAELSSIYDKEKGCEILWQADPAYWKRHAPVLFPNVGKNYGGYYTLNGVAYETRQHGFARDMDFVCVETADRSITHQLEATENTRQYFPFSFRLQITHTLRNREITVSWRVINDDRKEMYFTIGGHPAFRVPVLENTVQSDYSLTFHGPDSLTYLLVDPGTGTARAEESHTLSLENSSCKIDAHMFDRDALIFDNGQIEKVGIAYPDGTPYLEMTCKGFPNFGIWSVPGAPFVCLEPWMGRCDDYGFEGELSAKANINTLAPNEFFCKEYSIRVF